ncbi:MAG: hypothetical protein AB8B99_22725 [Phormidesmis sp.]
MKAKTQFLSFFCASSLAIGLLGNINVRSASAQQSSLCTQLGQSIGRLAYNAAFPLATYEGTTCQSVNSLNSGTDYRFRVTGRGIWQNAPLWTDVIFTTDSAGRFQNIRWGNHNSPFWPPGTSYIATAEAIGEFNRALQSPSSSAGSAGAICLQNPTSYKLYYKYRWGSGQWESDSLDAGSSSRYWWNYSAGSQTSPTFQIEFDNSMSKGYTPSSYNLSRNIVSQRFSCSDAKRYAFSVQSGRVDMRALP